MRKRPPAVGPSMWDTREYDRNSTAILVRRSTMTLYGTTAFAHRFEELYLRAALALLVNQLQLALKRVFHRQAQHVHIVPVALLLLEELELLLVAHEH